jgi:hypothetical protein
VADVHVSCLIQPLADYATTAPATKVIRVIGLRLC